MKITRVQTHLLHVLLARPRASLAEMSAGRLNHIVTLVVTLDTDAGLTGLGVAYALQSSGRALHAIAADDLAPLVVGEDPLDHERLGSKVYWRLQTVGRRGLVQQAYSAFDVALWDLKGKAANLPLYKLLGGARPAAPCYGADAGWLWMEPEEIVEAARPYVEQGVGIKIKVGAAPQEDADKVARVREALGDDTWLAVDANERYDFGTALALGHFFEEDVGCAWFEEPISCEDVEGHARLKAKLEIPLALGEMLFSRDEFIAYHDCGACDVFQPDVTRVGGITPWLKVAALAEGWHRPVSPHVLPEIGVHLCCGLPVVTMVEYMPWLFPLYENPPQITEGKLLPPDGPGLGLRLHADNLAKFQVEQSTLGSP